MKSRYAFRSTVRQIFSLFLTAVLMVSAVIDSTDAYFTRPTTEEVPEMETWHYGVDPCVIYVGGFCNSPSYQQFPHTLGCQYYYYCDNGRWREAYCGVSLYYSINQFQCTSWDGTCFSGCPGSPIARLTTASVIEETSYPYDEVDPCTIVSGEFCDSPSHLLYPYKHNCNFYFYCTSQGRWNNGYCGSSDIYFSTVQRQCAPYDGSCFSGCSVSSEAPLAGLTEEVSQGITESYDVDPCTIRYYEYCSEPPHKLYPEPGWCNYYFYCGNYRWIHERCPSGLTFSTIQHQCTNPDGSCFPYCPSATDQPETETTATTDTTGTTGTTATTGTTGTTGTTATTGTTGTTDTTGTTATTATTGTTGTTGTTLFHETTRDDITLIYDVDPCDIYYGGYCSSPSYQLYPDRWECNWYYYCSNGRWTNAMCPTNTWFSTVQHQCTSWDNSCFSGCPTPTDTAHWETTTYRTETTTTTTVPGQCRATPCIHGSLCFDDSNQYKCECETGYTGQFCQLDKCLSGSPCVHGTICLKEMGSYKCDCFPGYTGFYCENRIDYCASRPCDNGATCLDTGNGYVCHCQAGYTGLRCETDINECASENCLNGGVCEDLIGGFVCNCAAGFTGRYCEYNINECASGPCVNDSACIDGVNGYRCQCLAGFTGVHCETEIDECASNPCYNDGRCENLINEFKCECSVWYTGDRCEYERCPDSLLVHQHLDGPFFYKSWQEMQYQTGSHSSDFWIGLVNFNSIIQNSHSGGLMVVLNESVTNQVYFAKYENFHVGTAADNFRMTVSGFGGSAGDALGFHSGAQFSSWDRDNDLSSNNLAEVCGAFWYNSNSRANIAADNAMISFVWYPEDRYIKLDKVSMYLCRPAQYTVSV